MPLFFLFNLVGIAMGAVAGALFLSLNGLLRTDAAGMIAGALLALMDLGWRGWKFLGRTKHPDTQSELDSPALGFISPREGGNLLLLPVWMIGVLLVFFCGRTVFAHLLS